MLSDPFTIAGLEVGFKEGVLEGGFEVGDLDMGPDMVDVGAEGTGGTGLGGGNPKPRSASESLADARRCLFREAGVGASTCSGSPMSTSACFFLPLELVFFLSLK